MFFCIKIFRKCPLLLPIGTSALPLLAYTLANHWKFKFTALA